MGERPRVLKDTAPHIGARRLHPEGYKPSNGGKGMREIGVWGASPPVEKFGFQKNKL